MEPVKYHNAIRVPTKDVGESVGSYMALHDLHSIFVFQQYSMRSYETGLYDILTDGNVNSMCRILFGIVSHSKKLRNQLTQITITVPDAGQVLGGRDSINELRNRVTLASGIKVNVCELEYGENAKANRYILEKEALEPGAMNISYFRHSQEAVRDHYVFVCPGSPRPENPLYDPEEGRYFQEAIRDADMTFFYNWNQVVLLDGFRCFEASGVTFEISRVRTIEAPLPKFDYYFPYRISDKDYLFQEFVSDLPTGAIVAVTDPNESLGKIKPLEVVQSPHNPGVTLLKIDPKTHLDVVRAIVEENERERNRNKSRSYEPIRQIVMTPKLHKTLHMGPVEMFSIAYPLGKTRDDGIRHFHFVEGGTTEFAFEEECVRALGRKS